MTKRVRVENADGSSYKVVVWIEDLINGTWVRQPEPKVLNYAADLLEVGITNTRRLVVEEQ